VGFIWVLIPYQLLRIFVPPEFATTPFGIKMWNSVFRQSLGLSIPALEPLAAEGRVCVLRSPRHRQISRRQRRRALGA